MSADKATRHAYTLAGEAVRFLAENRLELWCPPLHRLDRDGADPHLVLAALERIAKALEAAGRRDDDT